MDEINNKVPETTPNENTPIEITEMLSNPKVFAAKIKELAQKLQKDKEVTEQIKNSNFLKNLFRDKTKMHTEAMERLNGMMTDFYQILTAVSFLTKGNSALLCGLYSSLCEDEKANNMEGNLFYTMAKDNLKMAIDSSENEQLREKALKIALVSAKSNEVKMERYKESTHKRLGEAVSLVKEHINLKKEESDKYIEELESKLSKDILSTINQMEKNRKESDKHMAEIKLKLSDDILSTNNRIEKNERDTEKKNKEYLRYIKVLTYTSVIAVVIGIVNILLYVLS